MNMLIVEVLNRLEIEINCDMVEDALECIEIDMSDTIKDQLYTALEEIDYSGALHERIDSNIDIYYYDLWKWASENYEWIDEAIEEGLSDPANGIISCIQSGQYCKLSQEAYEEVSRLQDEVKTADYDLLKELIK